MVTARGGDDGDGPIERSLFEFEVCFQVNLFGGDVFVAEPQRDDGGVDPGVQQSHGGGVPQGVGCDVLVHEGRARRCRSSSVNGHALSDGVEAERSTPVGWEQRILPSPIVSVIQSRSTVAVAAVSGVMRCLRPFPRQLTCVAVSR